MSGKACLTERITAAMTGNGKGKRLMSLALALASLSFVTTGSAQTYNWQGPDTGDWNTPANWNDTVPGPADTAVLSDTSGAGATVNLDADVTVMGLQYNGLVSTQTIASTGNHSLSITKNDTDLAVMTAKTLVIGSGATVNCNSTGGGASTVLIDNGGTLKVTGTVNANGPAGPGIWTTVGAGKGGPSTLILAEAGVWNQNHSFINVGEAGPEQGVLILRDTAQLNTLQVVLGTYWGYPKAFVYQQGGTVTLNLYSDPDSREWFFPAAVPALLLGGANETDWGADSAGKGEYHLSGGTLSTPSVGGGLNPRGDSTFYFDGGTLLASGGDSEIPSDGWQTVFMANVRHVLVRNGAVVDTGTNSITIAQNLEHDPDLGATVDGGLDKKGSGTLTVIGNATYTGPTVVEAGVLSVGTSAGIPATDLEIHDGAQVNLPAGVNVAVETLTFAGVKQASGTWGATDSGATHIDDTHFTGTGVLTVAWHGMLILMK